MLELLAERVAAEQRLSGRLLLALPAAALGLNEGDEDGGAADVDRTANVSTMKC